VTATGDFEADFLARVDETEARLANAAREAGAFISGDGRISEADAAKLLGYTREHLKHKRHEGRAPRYFHIGLNGSKVSYRLRAIAFWLEQQADDASASNGMDDPRDSA
jgi:hypothetical protein